AERDRERRVLGVGVDGEHVERALGQPARECGGQEGDARTALGGRQRDHSAHRPSAASACSSELTACSWPGRAPGSATTATSCRLPAAQTSAVAAFEGALTTRPLGLTATTSRLKTNGDTVTRSAAFDTSSRSTRSPPVTGG